ncbi:MAG TPA: PTS sugar transporter, partial [Epsilonproteobacteria bacterium]|nr:PTS sugar transporter [Campylobacterota bacterium]
LFVLHALLTGLALAVAQMLDIHAGFGFSAGFIDYVTNYKIATHPLLLLPLGLLFALIYFISSYYTIKLLKLKIMDVELSDEKQNSSKNDEASAFILALGGKENILSTDACITRLRMAVKDNTQLSDNDFSALGAKGVIRPDKHTIQIVLGTKAESVAENIKNILSSH